MRGWFEDESERAAVLLAVALVLGLGALGVVSRVRSTVRAPLDRPRTDVATVAARVDAFYSQVARMDVAVAMYVWRASTAETETFHGRIAWEPRVGHVEVALGARGFVVEEGELVLGEPGEGPAASQNLAAMVDTLRRMRDDGLSLVTLPRDRDEPEGIDVLEVRPIGDEPFDLVRLLVSGVSGTVSGVSGTVSGVSGTEGVVLRIIGRFGDDFVRLDLSDFHFAE